MQRIQELERLGQSVWLDTIDRELLTSGGLRRLIAEDGVRGVTTNPTIFEHAITHGAAYDAEIASLAAAQRDAAAMFESLEVADVRAAADQLRPVHDASGGADGFVSIEVAPTRAFDTAATVVEARRLWERVDRPNVMVKVPGTVEGLPAIEQLIADGVNVNITLLFCGGDVPPRDRGVPGRAGAPPPGAAAAGAAPLRGELLREPGGQRGGQAAR